jgi:hypothetical protein
MKHYFSNCLFRVRLNQLVKERCPTVRDSALLRSSCVFFSPSDGGLPLSYPKYPVNGSYLRHLFGWVTKILRGH